MNTHSTTLSSPVVSTRIAPAVSALLLGLFLFIGAGFAGPTILHNSTHDTRPLSAFPATERSPCSEISLSAPLALR